jgi:hypothetical protein
VLPVNSAIVNNEEYVIQKERDKLM